MSKKNKPQKPQKDDLLILHDFAENYLHKYKFATWEKHSDGRVVTDDEKKERASEIANQLCNHSLWLSHSRRISRKMAHENCRLQIIHTECINGLDRALKQLWALAHYGFINRRIIKLFLSQEYMMLNQSIPKEAAEAKQSQR